MNKLFLKIAKEVLQREIEDQEISTLILEKNIWQDILNYLKKIKNTEKKLDYCESLLTFSKEKKISVAQALLLREIGNTLEKQNHFEKSLFYLEKALKVFESEECYLEQKELLSHLAASYQKRGEFIKSLGYFERAKKLDIPKENTTDNSSAGKAALITKHISEVVHSYEKSLLELIKELENARKEHNSLEERRLLFKIGKVYEQLKKEEEAIGCWKDALLLAQKYQDDEMVFQTSYALGKVLLDRKELAQAKDVLVQGISCLMQYKDCLGTLSYSFVKNHLSFFYFMIDCCLSQGNFLNALYFLEQSIRWFYFSRIEEKILLSKSLIPQEIKEEYLLALEKYQKNFREGLDVQEEKKTVQTLRLQIELLDTDWANFWGHQCSIDLPLLQQKLVPGTVLLEFFATEKKCLIFLLDACHFETLVVSHLTSLTLKDLYEDVLQSRNLNDSMQISCKQMHKGLQKISESIGGKVLELLENWEADRLVFIPCYTFQLFPLHLLPLSDQQQEGLVWQDRYEIVYFPSLFSFMQTLQKKEEKSEGNILILESSRKNYKFFQQERPMIENLWEKKIMKENSAIDTWENLENLLSTSSYLHLSLHTSLFFPDSLLSILYLGQEKKGLLNCIFPTEILAKNLSSLSMVFFSATELQIQEWDNSGDMMGLFKAFLYAGAKVVVTNLWPVPDCVSYLIIEKFYQGIIHGLPPVMALQESQKEIRQMTVSDLKHKLDSLKQFLHQEKWLKELSDFLEYKNRDFPLEKRRQILKCLWNPRYVKNNDLAYKENSLNSISNEEEEIFMEREITDSQNKIFSDSFYWGSFVCIGMGLRESQKQYKEEEREEDENFDSVHIEEIPDEEQYKNMQQEVQDAISSFSPLETNGEEASLKDKKESKKIRDKSQYRIKGRCSYCGKKIRCLLSSEGSRVRCPHCKKKIWIPIQSSPFDDIKIPALCPYCTKKIHCFLTMAGSRGKCPKCNKNLRIPKRDALLAEIASGDSRSPVILLKDKE